MKLFKSIFDYETKELKKANKLAEEVESYEEEMSKLKSVEFKAKTESFKKRIEDGETLDDILPEAFAVAREACFRAIGEKPFFCQLIGAICIHRGNIAEMKTGEGKTLTTVLPAYLNSLSGKGTHVITTNEYLSTRNAEWMGPIYDLLGVSVGINIRDKSPEEKKEAYNADITYTTNNELGFDYLRDNMVVRSERRTQRGLNFAIIDEVDSILIDEARTPLIISGGSAKSTNIYKEADRIAKNLKIDDYVVDEKTKKVTLTEEGVKACEKMLSINNLYDISNSVMVHNLDKALSANYSFKKDVDYVIEDGKIIIVDLFTGRLMHGRQFSEGLHQALEAKEGVEINEETKTLATITFQNLFRMYNKLSGMTGTAKTEEEEFENIYNTSVVVIPTNKPVIREDQVDLIYSSLKGKYNALVSTIKEINKTKRPILVGVASVETSEIVSQLLSKAGLKHELLNAKNHEREAHIIENAGKLGSITIATNMAGRGTDIKLGDGVRELGGLFVLGTERHDSRRIDNQLRGRAGRQGDPGTTRFFVSMEDDLMIKFGSEKMKSIMETLGIKGDQAISNKMISKNIEAAQKKVEGFNFDRRKGLLDYDNVISKQREIIYDRRNEILDKESIRDRVLDTFKVFVSNRVKSHIEPEGYLTHNDIDNIIEQFNAHLLKRKKLEEDDFKDKSIDEVIDMIYNIVVDDYNHKLSDVPLEIQNDFEKSISLRIIDKFWMDQLDAMEDLKEGVGLRGYAQSNPLQVYALEGFQLFDNMMESISAEISNYLLNAEIRQNIERQEVKNIKTNDGKEGVKNKPKVVGTKTGRNDPCPCGSGKKYKQCCGK
ncbi:MAG: preprotein translocase subunit SecA [Tenericutes bacterium]|nr:preprotein translocase subunit SecA [Mycoplasmatota bacterium]